MPMWKCPVCDTEYEDSVAFCLIDGTPKVEKVITPVATPNWFCSVCYTENDGLYCKHCGRKKGLGQDSPTSSKPLPSAQPKARTWVCGICKTTNSETASICVKCRKSRDDNYALRQKMYDLEAKKNGARACAILCIVAVLLMFAFPYIDTDYRFTVYNNIMGYNGAIGYDSVGIVKACSIVVLLFVLLPIPFLLAKLNVRSRNLPYTIAMISAGAVAIYCAVIFFTSLDVNGVLPLIFLAQALCAVFARRYKKMMEEIENLLYHSRL